MQRASDQVPKSAAPPGPITAINQLTKSEFLRFAVLVCLAMYVLRSARSYSPYRYRIAHTLCLSLSVCAQGKRWVYKCSCDDYT